jgi:tRNA A37 threonylcarbamoyladenosine dehydratase
MLYGAGNIESLKSRRVAVFGIGGVGGHCAEALCRTGVGAIDLFDGDTVDITNINRQIIATLKTVGRDKVEAMRERLLEINPHAAIEARKMFYLPETADGVDLSVYDYVIDAVDTMAAKIELVCRATTLGVPVISSMGAANKLDPTALAVADIYETSVCPMARIMRSELRKRGVASLKVVYSKEPPVKPSAPPVPSRARRQTPASNAFVPPAAGLIIAAEVVKDLVNQEKEGYCTC